MKKLYLPAVVIAAITLASCAKQEIMTDPTPVQFDTFVGKSAGVQTKGAVLTSGTLKQMGFYVQAYMTGAKDWKDYKPASASTEGDFMAHQHITSAEPENPDNNAWTYTPVAFWPANNGKVTFFAYGATYYEAVTEDEDQGPYGMDSFTVPGGTANAQASFNFTTLNTPGDQIDLVAAAPQFNKFKDKASTNPTAPVDFDFKHILSKIDFKAQLALGTTEEGPANRKVEVTGLSVKYKENMVLANGTFTFANDDTGATSPGVWSTDYSDLCHDHDNYYPLFAPGDPDDYIELTTTGPLSITDDQKSLMLIPQNLEAGAFTIELKYDITTTDDQDTRIIHYTTKIPLPENNLTLDQGKQYTFRLKLNLANKVTMSSACSVSDWGTAEEKQTDIE